MANKQAQLLSKLPSEGEIKRLIAHDEPEDLVRIADGFGEHLVARRLTTNQIRNIFGAVRQIEMNWRSKPNESYRQAVLLKPKLGYAAARERGQGMQDLESVLAPALTAITEGSNNSERHLRFGRFVDFFEAILAYHKKYGGN